MQHRIHMDKVWPCKLHSREKEVCKDVQALDQRLNCGIATCSSTPARQRQRSMVEVASSKRFVAHKRQAFLATAQRSTGAIVFVKHCCCLLQDRQSMQYSNIQAWSPYASRAWRIRGAIFITDDHRLQQLATRRAACEQILHASSLSSTMPPESEHGKIPASCIWVAGTCVVDHRCASVKITKTLSTFYNHRLIDNKRLKGTFWVPLSIVMRALGGTTYPSFICLSTSDRLNTRSMQG
eukprot:32725-Chlamydomonas_euryale.AAC.10